MIRDEQGFTLIEIMVTITVLSLVAAGMLRLFGTGIDTISVAGERTTAMYKAQSAIEESLVNVPAGQETFSPIFFQVDGKQIVVDDVKGRYITKEIPYDNDEKVVSFTIFVPAVSGE